MTSAYPGTFILSIIISHLAKNSLAFGAELDRIAVSISLTAEQNASYIFCRAYLFRYGLLH